jgi:hypothetical protein
MNGMRVLRSLSKRLLNFVASSIASSYTLLVLELNILEKIKKKNCYFCLFRKTISHYESCYPLILNMVEHGIYLIDAPKLMALLFDSCFILILSSKMDQNIKKKMLTMGWTRILFFLNKIKVALGEKKLKQSSVPVNS